MKLSYIPESDDGDVWKEGMVVLKSGSLLLYELLLVCDASWLVESDCCCLVYIEVELPETLWCPTPTIDGDDNNDDVDVVYVELITSNIDDESPDDK